MLAGRLALVLVLGTAGACGRIGYESIGRDLDGPDDTDAADAGDDAPSSLIHQYHLNGNYLDDLGGPALTDHGGTFVADGYQFGPNQGLSVTGAMPDQVYTVDLVFSFQSLVSWRKILDYKNLTSDNGFYTYDDKLQFVVVAGSVFATSVTSNFTADVMRQVTITRDAAGVTTGFVDRVQYFQFTDDASVAALTAPGAVAHFFIDDADTGGGESAGGTVRRIRIFDRALTADEIPP